MLAIVSTSPAAASGESAILDSLVHDGASVAMMTDQQLDQVRAKGNTYFLNLSPADINKVYNFYDSNYNYIGDSSWHKVLGPRSHRSSSGGNTDTYYGSGYNDRLFRINWDTSTVYITATNKVIAWLDHPIMGRFGNFGSVAGKNVTGLPYPNSPMTVILY
jgi:hypothetical protein